ncbi:MAG TPA: MarR family transcriptional regulator, partial [Candidatus Competibacter sp.]|nr:MarR family transcriptional regulator [Candidatus Competibacter sp.]
MPEETSHLGLYRAGLTSAAHRQHITVARAPLVQDTLEILRGSMSRNSKHHFLFIGPRGIGKTHLLSLIEDEITASADLAAHYVIARFPEESHRTLSFADFLLGLCEILGDILPDEPLWRDLHQRLRTEDNDATIVDTLVPTIRRQNRERRRTVLVMLENLGEIFTRQIKKKTDIGALRKFFMDDNGCLLIATAPLHFDAITSVEEPFYDFFDVQILEDLSAAETVDLIRRNLEWEQRNDLLQNFDALRPKLLALYKMTGGNPRLTVMLYELIAHDAITEVRQQFQILLDRITPFYQSRLNDLPPQERAVLETMAVMRDQEKTPAAITARMRLSQPQTSSLLKRLTEARYLRSTPHPQDKRSRLYTIREGFFDIWLAMNLSRGARERLPFLLDFFTLFYPSIEERERKRAELRGQWGNGDAEQASDYLSEVGLPEERAVAKLDLARLHAQNGSSDKTVQYFRQASLLPLHPP